MRKYVFILLLAAVSLNISCRKNDLPATEKTGLSTETRFINSHRSTDPAEKAIVEYVKRINTKTPFIEETVKRIGYPYWDKTVKHATGSSASLVSAFGTRKAHDMGGSSDVDIYYVPFVRDSQNYVNASMVIRATHTDTSISYLCDWQYRTLPNNNQQVKDSAEYLSVFFMVLDNKVFGHTRFKIIDQTLFRTGQNMPVEITLNAQATNLGSQTLSAYVEFCQDVTVSYAQGQCWYVSNNRTCGNAPEGTCDICGGPLCMSIGTSTYTYCWGEWVDSGGSSGTGSGDTGGSDTGPVPPDPCNPTPPVSAPDAVGRQVQSGVSAFSSPCGGGPGWTPTQPTTYQLTSEDIAIFQEINIEDTQSDVQRGTDCYGTNRTGNIKWPGTLEHWIIMVDYLVQHPISGVVEYSIPQSSGGNPNNRGFADIADKVTAQIFEIKPNNIQSITNGRNEVANYVAMANQFCPPQVPPALSTTWNKGTNYNTRYLYWPNDNTKMLRTTLAEAGIIAYDLVNKNTVPSVEPVAAPQSITDQLKNLIHKLKANPSAFDRVIAEFLRSNPNVVNYIKAAGISTAVTLVIGTIIEDVLSVGVGIADDWASFVLAYRVVRFAMKL